VQITDFEGFVVITFADFAANYGWPMVMLRILCGLI